MTPRAGHEPNGVARGSPTEDVVAWLLMSASLLLLVRSWVFGLSRRRLHSPGLQVVGKVHGCECAMCR